MKKNGILSIKRGERSLVRTREFWQKESYRDRDRKIVEFYKQHSGGHAPSKNMWCIREMILDITPEVTLGSIVKAVEKMRDVYVIECFQISIDRKAQQAHLLFDFLNRETMAPVEIHQSNIAILQVYFIKRLGLPVSSDLELNWSHFSIRCELMQNPKVLSDFLEECKHTGMSRYFQRFARDMVLFVEQRMSKSTEKLKKIK